jgi:flagellar motor component MotA
MRNAPTIVALAKRAAIALGIVTALLAFVYGIFLAYGGNATGGATWLLVSIGSFSASIAYYGVSLARKTAREQNTISFIKDYHDNARRNEAYPFLRKVRDEGLLAPYFEDKESPDRKNFLALMNKLEALAIGVKYNVYDEQLIREMFGNEVKEVCQIAKPLIALIRKEEAHPTAFCELEKLAKRLADAP